MVKFYTLILCLLSTCSFVNAQAPNISYPASQTFVVGNAITPVSPTNSGGAVSSEAVVSSLQNFSPAPLKLVEDLAGNLIFSAVDPNTYESNIFKRAPDGTITRLLHLPLNGYFDEYINDLAVDNTGNIYFTFQARDSDLHGYSAVYKLSNGVLNILAGGGRVGSSNGIGTAASFYFPTGIAIDKSGNVYVADQYNCLIRKITSSGVVSTIAGSGGYGSADGIATAATFQYVKGITIDGGGVLYVSENDPGSNTGSDRIRKITPDGTVSTIHISTPQQVSLNDISADANGNIYGAAAHIVYKISASGAVSQYAGIGYAGSVDGLGSTASFGNLQGITIDNISNIYVADYGNTRIRTIAPGGYLISPALPAGLGFDTNTGVISGTPTAIMAQTAYTVVVNNPSGTSSFTFAITVVSPQSITFASLAPKSYGDADFAPGALASSGLAVSYTSSNANTATIVNGNIHIVGAGTATITASQAGNSDYAAAPPLSQALTVQKVPLTITAANAWKVSGTPNPAFFANYSGFVKNETPAALTTQPLISTTAVVSSPPDSYPINVSGAAAANYAISYVPGTLTIAGPPPDITYTTPQTYTAGTAITALSPANAGGAVPATVYGMVSSIAGSKANHSTVNGTGAAAGFLSPNGVAIDAAGNLYVSDFDGGQIRKIAPTGVVSTFAGSGANISADGTGIAASFNGPAGLAFDGAGNLYVAETNAMKIRKITPAGVVTTFAGSGSPGFTNGKGTAASFFLPQSVAVDVTGNVYVADRFNNSIRKITPDGTVSTLAGGSSGQANGTGTDAQFNAPYGIAADLNGSLYVTDQGNNMIRKITPEGVVTTLAGKLTEGTTDGTGSSATFAAPAGIAVDFAGNIFVSDQKYGRIRQITPSGTVTTLAGNDNGNKDGVGIAAGFYNPQGLAPDEAGNLYVADMSNYTIRKIVTTGYSIAPQLPSGLNFDISTGIISGTAGYPSATTSYNIAAHNASGNSTTVLRINVTAEPAPVISYSGAQVYTTATMINSLAPANTGGQIVTGIYQQNVLLAGGNGPAGQNGTGAAAAFSAQNALATDAAGNVYVADAGNNLIRKVTPAGLSSTIAGSGAQGAADGQGAAASFYSPNGLAVDKSGNIYVADRLNYLIRKITPLGLVSTFAGNGTHVASDGIGTSAGFQNPLSVAIDVSGNIFVLDGGNIRKILPDGTVSTFAATNFYGPQNIAIDASGNLYVAEYSNHKIRKITPAGVVSTIAGSFYFTFPYGITVDKNGNIFVSDSTPGGTVGGGALYYIKRVSRISPLGIVSPISLNYGGSLAIDGSGNLFATSDAGNSIHKIITTNYYTIKPSLPKGLVFDETTGIISGTPAIASPSTVYSVSAYNSGGRSTTTVSIQVKLQAAPKISYTAGALKFTPGVPISPLVPANAGGAVPATIYGQTVTLAGNGSAGALNGPGTAASFNNVTALAVDGAGNLFAADQLNNLIRKISPAGMVTTYAGNGQAGSFDGPVSSSGFNQPLSINIDGYGNLYVLDGASVIRQITPGGLVSSLNLFNYQQPYPVAASGLVLDANGKFYDLFYNAIFKIDPNAGANIFAGSIAGKKGNVNGQDTAARFYNPQNLALAVSGDLFVADLSNNLVRKISPSGLVTTLAGSGAPGFVDGAGTSASFYNPRAVVSDPAGNLFVGDASSIRRVSPDGLVTIVAGGDASGAADGVGSQAGFSVIAGLALDAYGNLYVADANNNLVRKVSTTGYTISPALPPGLNFDSATGIISGTPQTAFLSAIYTITAYNAAGSNTTTINFGAPALQTITFNPLPSKTVGNADFDPGASTTSGLPVAYASSDPTVATIVNGLVHITGIGTTTITASQNGNALYLPAATVTQTLTVNLGTQTVTFNPLASQHVWSPDFDPGATVDSGLPITYTSSNPAVATIVSGLIHIVGAGTCTISAYQAGNQFYAPSNTVSQSLTVLNKVSQVITFNALSPVSYGQPDFSPNASANSGLPVTYTSSDPTIATIVNGFIHIQNIGTVTITATQAGNYMYSAATSSQQLTINMGTQVIIFPFIYNVTYGSPDMPLNAYSTNASIPVSYASSDNTVAVVVNGSLHIVGAGTVTITVSQSGNSFYNPAVSVSRQVTVNKAPQTISFTLATPITYTTTDFAPGATASSGLLPTYTSSDATVAQIINGNIHVLKPGTVSIVADQAGDANYLSAPSVTQKITITKASQMVSFVALRPVSYGSGTVTPAVSSSSGLTVALASSDTTVARVSGANLVIKGVGQSVITASQGGGVDYTAATPISQTLIVNPGDQTITFAALAAKTYGAADFTIAATASSKLAVTYTSSDPAIATVTGSTVHIVSAGTVTITASQAGSTLYNPAPSVSQTLTINPAAQTIIFNALSAKTYGAANYAPVASVASLLPVTFASSNPAVSTIVNGNIHIVGAGTCSITATQAGNTNYAAATPVSQTLTVNKAPLIIKPNNQTIIYGAAIPQLTLTYTSFVNGETSANLITQPTAVTTATAASPAGSYPITASGATAANYAITYQAGSLTITKASQTITFAALTPATYGSAPIALSGSASSGLPVAYASSDTTIVKVSGTTLVIRNVGQVTITASQAGNPSYNAAVSVSRVLTVGPGSQIITFAALPAKIYGAADFTIAATASSKLAVSYSSSDPTIATVTGSTVHIVSAGTVSITASQSGSTLYNAAPNVSQQLTISPAAQTIIFSALTAKTYGATDYAPVASVASKLPVSFTSSNPAVATILNGNIHIVGAGTSTITASQAGNTDYSAAAAVSQTLTVNKAALIIKPTNQAIIYGAAIPTLTLTYTGFVNGDTQAILTTQPAVVTTATATSPAGSYTITASGAAATNYTITYQLGSLTISKANQTITFAALTPATYGSAPITLTGSASSGLPVVYTSSDTTIAKVSGSSLVIKGVGQVTVTATQTGGPGYNAAAAVSRILTVGRGSQAITFAALPAKTYGAADFPIVATASSRLAVTYTSSDPTIATVTGNIVHIVSAGTVTITASQAGSSLYTAAPNVSQQLVISQIVQTIIFNALTARTYGAADYVPVASVASKLPVTFTSSNPAVATIVNGNIHIVGAGSSTITASQPGNIDYSAAAPVSQTLTINTAALSIKVNNTTKTYGAANPVFTFTYTGFVNGDSNTSLATQPAVATFATTASVPGSYALTVSGASSANYTISYIAGSLVIGKAPLIITADNKTKIAGSANPVLTVTYSGFVNSETPANLTTQAVAHTTALVTSPVGTYPITVGGAADPNYTITFVAGTLTVTASGKNGPVVADNPVQPDETRTSFPEPKVRSAVSPNGDGINDALIIDGIEHYPDNKLTLISRNGQKIFEGVKYDNINRTFNGRSNITGLLQPAGTYFYMLEYIDNGQTRRKTGFVIIKNN